MKPTKIELTEMERAMVEGSSTERDRACTLIVNHAQQTTGSFQDSNVDTHVASPCDQPLDTGNLWLRAGAQVGKYRIIRNLGQGGQGQVFLALDTDLDRQVALKTISGVAALSGERLARFRNEARAVAHLQHPNIVQLYEVFDERGMPFIAMEYVEGETLARLMTDRSLSRDQVVDIIVTCSDAMAYAHNKGILHRDLKPQNILVAGDGTAKVTDFGLAKGLMEGGPLTSDTLEGQVLGSPAYMAPEQANTQHGTVGPHTDAYALGIVLYQGLTRQLPYQAPTPMETLMRVLNEEPTAPSTLDPSIDRDLNAICLKAMAKDPKERYRDAAAMSADLKHYRNQEPVLAHPATWFERTRKSMRRNRDVAVIGGVALTFMAVALVTGITLLARYSTASVVDGFRKQLIGTVDTAALLFPAEDIEKVSKPKAEKTAEFEKVVARLNMLRQHNRNVRNAYIMRPTVDASDLSFVADADAFVPNGETTQKRAGDAVFLPQGSSARNAFAAATADPEPMQTRWGYVLSGYAPIRASNGSVIALIGLDLGADPIREQMGPALRTTLVVSALGAGLFLIFGLVTATRVLRRKRQTATI